MRTRLRLLATVLLAGVCLASPLFAPVVEAVLPATDDFNRADAGTLGANWTDQEAGSNVTGNVAKFPGSFVYAFWNADAFSNDHYSQAMVGLVGTATSEQYTLLTVRASATGGSKNLYAFEVSTGTCFWFKYVAGAFTLIETINSCAVVNGDTVCVSAVGTTMTAYRNGSSLDDMTDGDLASGSAGLAGNASNGSTQMDDWTGGDGGCVAGGGARPPAGALLRGVAMLVFAPFGHA